MKLFTLTAAVSLTALFISSTLTGAREQDDLQESAGTFVTSVGGREVARETYTFAPEPDGSLRAVCDIKPAQGPRQKLVTAASRTRPLSFTADVGETRVLTAEFGDGTVRLAVTGRPEQQLQTKATLVMENVLWHHFHFLLAQYDRARGGTQTFTFFSPNNGKDFEITAERLDSRAVAVKGQPLTVEHYRFVADKKLTIETWAGAGHIPLLFVGGDGRLKGVRVGYEELEAALAPGAGKATEYRPAPYSVPSAFAERDVTVGAGTEWALPGTVSMPVGRGPFPAVVLVHGSGPNDRDETLSASKPFRDLAHGLASQGVAVLRYDKRTLVHGAKFAAAGRYTVKEETIDDALSAAELLRRTPGVDPKRVFVLGHSLGAGLAPRFAALDPKLAGLVVMAGPTLPLEETIVRQFEYLLALDGTVSDDERKVIESVKAQTERVRRLTAADTDSKTLLHGAPAAYWLDLRAYDAVATAARLKTPMLVLQGERDYNVTLEDFRGWQRLAAARKGVTLKTYSKLDHLFLEGEGPATPDDYARPRNVPKQVIDDIAAFVKRR